MDTKTLLSSLATEQVNARSERLDQMSALEIVTLMNDVTADVTAGVSKALPALAEAVDAIVARMKKGGRLIYMGAGTSGRLGVLDASECPPTFGVSPELVEAARIDGATRFQIIRYVNVPTIMPTIIILFIMNFGSILSVGFEKIFLLQNSLNLSVSQVISTYVYNVGLISSQYSYSTAIGLFNTIINITLLIIVNLIVSKITEISLW